ncbi:bacillithiol biosynthesis cysteine-adding enzyme BshC [Flavobacteriaceae bacterium]|nr:bacillithiol biosynthesis cysteine-adding enzyme BshC [Flavobacteriaceae bacterium]MDB2632297.1 bacillithiol biosynthesis cysteine-adding enzyme BshC [Flavobacteriaceae bacterium]
MARAFIPYTSTATLPRLLHEVEQKNPMLESFYTAPTSIENFSAQMTAKAAQFSTENRIVLANCINEQYTHLNPETSTKAQIDALKQASTFTVTTGHQLNLMGGPLYFLYKIISVINLAKRVKEKYPKYTFVPVFWMATEDHDFEEINHFYFGEHRLKWQYPSQGPVGRLSTKELTTFFSQFSAHLGADEHSKAVIEMFQKAYIKQHNLADATRCLVHQLFGKNGLIVVDGDDAQLKRLFLPAIKNELEKQLVFDEVSKTNQALKSVDSNFKIQVNPRPLNLFYITDTLRKRIEVSNGIFRVLNTDLSWNLDGIIKELETHPERFSPNVLLRPLYQETILPNLCYVGGGGELSYWLQLKSCFDAFNINFPLLLHRNSAIIVSKRLQEKLKKIHLTIEDLFLSSSELSAHIVKTQSHLIDFSDQKKHLKQQFENLYSIAKQTDASFLGAVAAQEQKQLKGLSNLEKRLLKAEKRKHNAQIEKALWLQSVLFPNGNLQERVLNFSTFYADHGHDFIEKLKSELNPFQQGFTVISL